MYFLSMVGVDEFELGELLLLDVVVVRNTLGSPDANHEDITCLLVAFLELGQICGHYLVKVFFGEVDAVYLNSGALDALILPYQVFSEAKIINNVPVSHHTSGSGRSPGAAGETAPGIVQVFP